MWTWEVSHSEVSDDCAVECLEGGREVGVGHRDWNFRRTGEQMPPNDPYCDAEELNEDEFSLRKKS